MEKSKQDSEALSPLEPIAHFWFHKKCTPEEAYLLLPPELRGLFCAILAARNNAHNTAAMFGRTEEEQMKILCRLNELTTKTLADILSYPNDFALAEARKTVRHLSRLPEYLAQLDKEKPGM